MQQGFWSGRNVFITGHTGFKGTWLALRLSAFGARVSGYALAPATTPSLWSLVEKRAGIESQIADIRDSGALAQAMARSQPEIVFHLAAQSLVRPSYVDPVGTYATNVMGTVNLLEAVRRVPSVKAVVNVTSDKCYRNLETGRAYAENDCLGGHDPYSSSKACAELVSEAYRSSFLQGGPALATARAGNVIGGGDWATDRIVPDIVRAASAGVPVQVRNPNAVRPWQHVLEPLSGYIALAERLALEGAQYAEAWNFGPDAQAAVPVEEIVTKIIEGWGPPASWKSHPGEHPHEAKLLHLDSSKSRSRLQWRPKLTLKDAVQWTVDWYKRQSEGADSYALTMSQIERYAALG